MLEWIAMVIALSMPYAGPLADHQVAMPDLGYVSVVCPIDPIGTDGDKVRALANRFEKAPLAVLLPDSPELGYGLTGYEGQITIVRFNLLLIDAVRQLEASGKYPSGEDDTTVLAAAHVLQGGLPNTGETVEWALGALASFGVHDPAYPFADIPEAPADFPALAADWKRRASRYDRQMVHDLLRRWGVDSPEKRLDPSAEPAR